MSYIDLDKQTGTSSGVGVSPGIVTKTGVTLNAPSTTFVHGENAELVGITFKASDGKFKEIVDFEPTVGNELNSVDIPVAGTLSNVTLYLQFV